MMKVKIVLWGFLLILITVSCQDKSKKTMLTHDKPSELSTVYPSLNELSRYIDSLFVVDQQVQKNIEQAFRSGVSTDSLKILYAAKDSTFIRQTKLIKLIYHTYGYPISAMVGATSSSHFFTLIQHANHDVDFQKQMLSILAKEVSKGNVSCESFAYLTDRVLLADDQPQRYGTQLDYDESGNAFAKNLAHPETCNIRRAQYGLEPLEAYLKFSTETHRQMNPEKYK